jgi:predicted secreted Zn-dependent protease
MKRLILTALILVLAIPAHAEVFLNVITKEYGVTGNSKQDIMRSMQRRAPYKKGKSFVPAYTGTDMKFSYTLMQSGKSCSVKEVKVYLNLTYMYPRLAQHQSSTIRWWWRDIIKKYKIHEEIHGEISTRWAYQLDRELRSLKNMNCPSAQQIVKTRAKHIYAKMRNEQETYDKITQHGIKQHKYQGPTQ